MKEPPYHSHSIWHDIATCDMTGSLWHDAEYCLFYRALLQKRPIIQSILLAFMCDVEIVGWCLVSRMGWHDESAPRDHTIRCLIFIGHFPQKGPMISGSFVNNSLQLKGDSQSCSFETLRIIQMHVWTSYWYITPGCSLVTLCIVRTVHVGPYAASIFICQSPLFASMNPRMFTGDSMRRSYCSLVTLRFIHICILFASVLIHDAKRPYDDTHMTCSVVTLRIRVTNTYRVAKTHRMP